MAGFQRNISFLHWLCVSILHQQWWYYQYLLSYKVFFTNLRACHRTPWIPGEMAFNFFPNTTVLGARLYTDRLENMSHPKNWDSHVCNSGYKTIQHCWPNIQGRPWTVTRIWILLTSPPKRHVSSLSSQKRIKILNPPALLLGTYSLDFPNRKEKWYTGINRYGKMDQ